MRNSLKVAKWEIKRNLKNKTFLISLFVTPLLIVLFGLLGSLFGDDHSEKATVFVHDELGILTSMEAIVEQADLDLELQPTDINETDVEAELEESEDTAYMFVNETALTEGKIPVYTSNDFPNVGQLQILTQPIKSLQLQELGLTEEQMAAIAQNIDVQVQSLDDLQGDTVTEEQLAAGEDPLMKRVVPGIFAGIILLSIIFTGMMIFQSASQEKKDKIAEIILSSVTPNELMQGKIIGYFVLAMIQAAIILVFALGFALYKFNEFPLFEYLLQPQLLLFLLIAVLGYLLFASIFVGMGATMSDISTAGNFQGMIMMIPFISFFFIGPVLSDPTGALAKALTYIPFTSPTILLARLVRLDEWNWLEISISLVILVATIWLMMKLAGKIFKVGMLMYGKNATVGEIMKWLRT